jgi:CelD/BcsL family acetyltransferase involved in cellulose biosynthesis
MPKLSFQVLWGKSVISVLDERWDELERTAPTTTSFQTRNWYRAWITTVAEAEGAVPVIVRVPTDGRLRAAVALQFRTSRGVLVVECLTTPWADYHEAIGDPSDVPAVSALCRGLCHVLDALGAELDLCDVVPGGLLDTVATALGISPTQASVTAAINLRRRGTVARILERREHVRKWRRLERLGDAVLAHWMDRRSIRNRLPAFIAMHQTQWSSRPDAVAPFDGDVVDRGFQAIVDHMAPAGSVVLSELMIDGNPIAMYFGFRHRSWYGGYRTTFDRNWRRLSPGHLLLRGMVADFADLGLIELDLMRDVHDYKALYADLYRSNVRFSVQSSPRAIDRSPKRSSEDDI